MEWRVGRRWQTRRTDRVWRRPGELVSDTMSSVGVPDFPQVDSAEGLLVITVAAILLVLLVPILFFGIELIILGSVLATGLVGRLILRQPWVIEARTTGGGGAERQLEWQVHGWRRSRRLIDSVVADLSAGRDPDPPIVGRRGQPG